MATTQLLTAEDLEAMPSANNRYELIRGELTPMSPTGGRHGKITVKLSTPLAVHASRHGLGDVFGAETGFVLASDPDIVLAPDVAFVATDRIPADDELDRFLRLAPDLAVEVVSPSDTATEVFDKVLTYLDTGVRLVWIIEPRRRTVTVWAADRTGKVLTETDNLDGGDVLPDFRLPVSEIFG